MRNVPAASGEGDQRLAPAFRRVDGVVAEEGRGEFGHTQAFQASEGAGADDVLEVHRPLEAPSFGLGAVVAVAGRKVGPDGVGHCRGVRGWGKAWKAKNAHVFEFGVMLGGEFEGLRHGSVSKMTAPRSRFPASAGALRRSIYRGAVPHGPPQGAANDPTRMCAPRPPVNPNDNARRWAGVGSWTARAQTYLILPSLNSTCLRTTGSYFLSTSFSVMVRA